MLVMAGQRSEQMQREAHRPPVERRDPLVRNYFIVVDGDGRPARAGQIKTVTSAGDYVCAVWLGKREIAYSETVSPETPTREEWLLFQDEGSWRAAYAKLSR